MRKPFLPMLSALLVASTMAVAAPAPANSPMPTWVEANGVSLRYQLAGSGTSTVVLIHEIGMSLEGWDEIMPALTQTHRVLRYDIRGFGMSEKIHGKITMEDEVADLTGLLDALNIKDKVTLVGGALGSQIAFEFADAHPDRVKGLVAMSPVARVKATLRPPTPPGTVTQADQMEQDGSMRTYLKRGAGEGLFPPELRSDPARMARFWGIEVQNDPESRAATWRMNNSTGDMTEKLNRIKYPTLIVETALGGGGGGEVNRSKLVADAIPGSKFEVLKAGHLAAITSPDVVADALLRFLKIVDG